MSWLDELISGPGCTWRCTGLTEMNAGVFTCLHCLLWVVVSCWFQSSAGAQDLKHSTVDRTVGSGAETRPSLFLLGVDHSMIPTGEGVQSQENTDDAQRRETVLLLLLSFLIV